MGGAAYIRGEQSCKTVKLERRALSCKPGCKAFQRSTGSGQERDGVKQGQKIGQ